MGNHEPTALIILEHIGHEGIEAQRAAVLSEQFNLFDANRPCELSVRVNVRLRR